MYNTGDNSRGFVVNIASNKWIIAYQNGSGHPCLAVVDWNGSALSVGTEYVLKSSVEQVWGLFNHATDSTKVVVAYDQYMRVSAWSGTTIASSGTEFTGTYSLDAASGSPIRAGFLQCPNDKTQFMQYRDNGGTIQVQFTSVSVSTVSSNGTSSVAIASFSSIQWLSTTRMVALVGPGSSNGIAMTLNIYPIAAYAIGASLVSNSISIGDGTSQCPMTQNGPPLIHTERDVSGNFLIMFSMSAWNSAGTNTSFTALYGWIFRESDDTLTKIIPDGSVSTSSTSRPRGFGILAQRASAEAPNIMRDAAPFKCVDGLGVIISSTGTSGATARVYAVRWDVSNFRVQVIMQNAAPDLSSSGTYGLAQCGAAVNTAQSEILVIYGGGGTIYGAIIQANTL